MVHNNKWFKSNETVEKIKMKHNLTCKSKYVMYLIECKCGLQYEGLTIKHLHQRINKCQTNIKNGYQLHSLSDTALRTSQVTYILFPSSPLTIYLLTGITSLRLSARGSFIRYINSHLKNKRLKEVTKLML